ncbi:MAG: imidazole glycerol phosphate synthase subunit HisH [Thermoleophilia bacterium]
MTNHEGSIDTQAEAAVRTPDGRAPRVAVCEYGAGNVRSVVVAFRRLGADVVVTEDPAEVAAADLAVLPGVGAAATAMRGLVERGLDLALQERVAAGRPTLGICLGLQLAVESSEEDGGVPGLGILPGRAVLLREGRVPRIGWAPVEPGGEAFYFAHSYACDTPAASGRSEGVTAMAEQGSFVGVQFHPEKSGPAGARFLRAQLERAAAEAA